MTPRKHYAARPRSRRLIAASLLLLLAACSMSETDEEQLDADAPAAEAVAEEGDDVSLLAEAGAAAVARPEFGTDIDLDSILAGRPAGGRRGGYLPSGESFDEFAAESEAESELRRKRYRQVGPLWKCTEDCSGHDAGFAWAADNRVRRRSGCSGDSRSFEEGCETYVKERDALVEERRLAFEAEAEEAAEEAAALADDGDEDY